MRKAVIIVAPVFLVTPSATNANQKIVVAIKQKCILQMQTMFIDGRPYFETMKTSREVFKGEIS